MFSFQKNKPIHVGIFLMSNGFELAVVENRSPPRLIESAAYETLMDDHFDILLKEKVNQLGLTGVSTRLILQFGDYQILFMPKPNVPEHEIQSALKWLISEQIDFNPLDAIIDYIELPKSEKRDKSSMLYVVVADKSIIAQWCSRINGAGLHVTQVDIGQSALRDIALSLENTQECQALLHIEKSKTYIIVFKDKVLHMMREIDIGDLQLLAYNAKDSIRELALEIQRSCDYNESLCDQKVVRVLITPLKEKIPHLLSSLSDLLDLPVREIGFVEFLDNHCSVEDLKQSLAIGAAVGSKI